MCYTGLLGPLFTSHLSPSMPLLFELGIQPNFYRKWSTRHRTWAEWRAMMLSLPFNVGWIMRGSRHGSLGSDRLSEVYEQVFDSFFFFFLYLDSTSVLQHKSLLSSGIPKGVRYNIQLWIGMEDIYCLKSIIYYIVSYFNVTHSFSCQLNYVNEAMMLSMKVNWFYSICVLHL